MAVAVAAAEAPVAAEAAPAAAAEAPVAAQLMVKKQDHIPNHTNTDRSPPAIENTTRCKTIG